MRFAAALIWIVAALLIACSSESTSPAAQVGSETSTDARPSAATTTTGLPTATTAAKTTPPQPVPPATVEPTNLPTQTAAPQAQPETATAPTATPQDPATTAATVLRVTVSAVPATLPDYDRRDWKHWTDANGDCQDARNEVLIAESRTAVDFRTDRKCRVAAGEWLAPYSNTMVTDPGRLDVDHMVPLGNAHDSGAWQWSAEQRERYANYLEDPQHLIAVTASANRSKGARGPEEWKPDNRTYWCQYAVDWITIKSTWDLTVTEAELAGLNEMLYSCNEPPSLWVSHSSIPGVHRATSAPEPRPTATATTIKYNSCDAAQAAGETRVQGSKGNGRGFPKWMVPSARDGDGDGVVCETEDRATWEDDATLARIARNSFDASFLESRRRNELKAEPDAYLAANTVVEQ